MNLVLASLTGRLVVLRRRLARQCLWHGRDCKPEFHAPLPPPRFCGYCTARLPADAEPDQRYCNRTHQNAARRKRNHYKQR